MVPPIQSQAGRLRALVAGERCLAHGIDPPLEHFPEKADFRFSAENATK
jgi:hypothetical protein